MEKLLDKYEDRKEGSHKRVQIICSKKEVPIPELEMEHMSRFWRRWKS
ncbi:MAG: hypothetical protein IJ906_07300 [Oscillospiraceae bacterium]|nr:hypothetical protein [Oscillospiraceae bacterium]